MIGPNRRDFEVITIGEAMVMVTPRDPEPLATCSDVLLSVAGAESNVAIAMAGLGHRAGWISRVGDDPLGRRIVAHMRARGVDVSSVEVDNERRTGVFFKDPDQSGTAVFYYRNGSAAAAMSEAALETALASRPRILHLSGITPALSPTCERLVATALSPHSDHALRSFDVNFRPGLWSSEHAARPLEALARCADVVFVGLDEAAALWGTSSPGDVQKHLEGARTVVIKDGAVGATEVVDGASTFVPALSTPVADPVGAGDAFAAGWLSGWLRGLSARDRLRLGHIAAASALGSTKDEPQLPNPKSILGALEVDEPGWTQINISDSWRGA